MSTMLQVESWKLEASNWEWNRGRDTRVWCFLGRRCEDGEMGGWRDGGEVEST